MVGSLCVSPPSLAAPGKALLVPKEMENVGKKKKIIKINGKEMYKFGVKGSEKKRITCHLFGFVR